MSQIDINKIWELSDGGRDIILHYYPQAAKSFEVKHHKFKIRSGEKTSSSNVYRSPDDGVWLVTDFGDDSKSKNAIYVIMKEENCDFYPALVKAAAFVGLEVDGKTIEPEPIFSKRPAKSDEPDGVPIFDVYDTAPDHALKHLGPFVEDKHLKSLSAWALKSYTIVKNRTATTIQSTEDYPIYLFEDGDFKKIYQPKTKDKAYKFRSFGTRPKGIIMGFNFLKAEYARINKHAEEGFDEDGEPLKPEKLKVMFCSGEKDSVNCLSLGYYPLWFNSETETITGAMWKNIRAYADEIFNIPDLDKTGVEKARERALTYLELETAWLPDDIRKSNFNKKPGKDLTDWVNLRARHHGVTPAGKSKVSKEFDNILLDALPCQFWFEIPQFDKNNRVKDYKYEISNEHLYNFLSTSGFYNFKKPDDKRGYTFIQIEGNTVKMVRPSEIKKYVINFLRKRHMPVKLRNVVHRSPHVGESSLEGLLDIELDFKRQDYSNLFLFFTDKLWLINKDGVHEKKGGALDKFVWDTNVIQHKAKVLPPMFEIKQTQQGLDIDILDKESIFFKYLINASRVHWRKDLEESFDNKVTSKEAKAYAEKHKFDIAGPNLSDVEIREQKLHLINKMYCLGYIFYGLKNPSKAWAPYAMDNKITEDGQSHGGSGKSLFFEIFKYLFGFGEDGNGGFEFRNGKNPEITKDRFIFDGITKRTDLVLFDDCSPYFKLHDLFPYITGDFPVNPKNNKPYTIEKRESPMLAFSTNFAPRDVDFSVARRLLYLVFSDYYHFNKDDAYLQHRTVADDFGLNLYTDFDEKQWELTINFMCQCVVLFMNNDKIDPPMDNVTKRNLIAEMTETFKSWADVYFSDASGKKDTKISKEEAFKDFQNNGGGKMFSPNRIKKSLVAWCRYYGYEFNPQVLVNDKSGRIIQYDGGSTHEMLYIYTGAVPLDSMKEEITEGDKLMDGYANQDIEANF